MNQTTALRGGILLLAFFALITLLLPTGAAEGGDRKLYLPLIQNTIQGTPTTPTATATQPNTPPTVTPTATQTQQPPSNGGKLYITTQVETASASAQVDANGGQHAAFIHYTSAPDPSPAVYAVCTASGAGCDNPANWSMVELAADTREVQLRLTPDGKPRLLIVADSTIYPGGKDYIYGECNSDCTTLASWSLTVIDSSDGTAIFDTLDESAPQRSFALDPQGNPAFIFQDRNYLIEPDRYGAIYASCVTHCYNSFNWTRTNIAHVTEFDYEIFKYPALAFTSDGKPRILSNVFAMNDDGSEAPDGLYYYACDTDCNDISDWNRTLLFYPGSGSFPAPSWDMEVGGNGQPHVVFFTGGGADQGIDYTLVYLTCTVADCFAENTWNGTVLGLNPNDGQTPDIELTAAGNPRVAFMMDSGALGYAWCDVNCAASNAGWNGYLADTPAEQEADNPQALPPNCDAALWQGITPTLALDAAGNPRIAYDVQVDARCDGGSFARVWNGARWVFFPQP